MIASVRGILQSRSADRAVVEAAGIGYEVWMAPSALARLPEPGGEAFLLISESFSMYGGGATLYGFVSAEEKALFETFRDHVPSTGAKKALEYLEKASKSLPDFRRAILEKDGRMLSAVFGFTKKTADRLIDALKDALETVPISGHERIARADRGAPTAALAQALEALSALGYRSSEARAALALVSEEAPDKSLTAEEIVRRALRKL